MESGTIIEAEVREGDEADTHELSERVMVAIHTLEEVCTDTPKEKIGKEMAADEGYFAIKEIGILQEAGIRTVIAEPHAGKRRKDLAKEERAISNRATRATKSKSGKALLKRRGELLERGFCHVLDHGGMRKASLRGRANLSKRYVAAAFSFNLSLPLRTLFGIGTPKQWLASGKKAQTAFLGCFLPHFELWIRLFEPRFGLWFALVRSLYIFSGQNPGLTPTSGKRPISTSCYPSDLSDAQWALIESLAPKVKLGGRPAEYERREIVNGIFYVLRSGCAWRMMPHDFPYWESAYSYFRMWSADGTWERIDVGFGAKCAKPLARNPRSVLE